MTSANPGQTDPGWRFAPRSAPIAVVSRAVLEANAVRAAADLPSRLFDATILDGDAWGHGAQFVREALHTAGFAVTDEPGGVTTVLAPPALYGLRGGVPGYTPALRLYGTVLSTKRLRAGEGVSYGYTHRAPADTRVALVAGGYAQGIVRALGDRATVKVGGRSHAIVGRVAMDVCVVDIGDAEVDRGDPVVFLGDPRLGEPSIQDWAALTGLRPAELVTTVGLRAHREHVP